MCTKQESFVGVKCDGRTSVGLVVHLRNLLVKLQHLLVVDVLCVLLQISSLFTEIKKINSKKNLINYNFYVTHYILSNKPEYSLV